jgi:hypothetical protein
MQARGGEVQRTRKLMAVAGLVSALTFGACEPEWARGGDPIGVLLFQSATVGDSVRQIVTATFMKNGRGAPQLFPKNACTFAEGARTAGGYIPSDRFTEIWGGTVENSSMNAGPFIAVESDQMSMQMPLSTSLYTYSYYLPANLETGFHAAEGDSVAVSIPGAEGGFGAVELALRIATPVAIDTNSTGPAQNAPMTLTWVPDPVPGSRVFLNFPYTLGYTLSPTVQIFCEFDDDGNAEVEGVYMDHYRQYKPYHLPMTVGRYTESRVALSDGSHFAAFSVRMSPLPPFPSN